MHVLIAGSSGLIGSALTSALRSHGAEVSRLVRREARKPDEFSWDPESFGVPDEAHGGLTPSSPSAASTSATARGRSLPANSCVTRASRRPKSSPTRSPNPTCRCSLSAARRVSRRHRGPRGHRGRWTRRRFPRRPRGRLGGRRGTGRPEVTSGVLAHRAGPRPRGGLLGRLRPLVKVGLGGRLGDGKQYLSWISLRDGGGNRVPAEQPRPRRTGEPHGTDTRPLRRFIRTYGSVLHQPTRLPVPAAVLRTLGGDMARGNDLGVLARCTRGADPRRILLHRRDPRRRPDVDTLMSSADSARRSLDPLEVRWLGTVDYRSAYDEQHALAAARADGTLDHDVLLYSNTRRPTRPASAPGQ